MSRSCVVCGSGALLCIAATLGGVPPAAAHDETMSVSDVLVDGPRVRWRVDVGVDELRKVIPLPDGAVTEDDLAASATALGRYVSSGLRLVADGRPLEGTVTVMKPGVEPYVLTGAPAVARANVEIAFVAPAPIDELRAGVAFFADVTARHRAVIDLRWEERGETRSFAVRGPSQIVVHREGRREWASRVVAFLGWGVCHIFTGYDHLAFLLALLVTSSRLRQVVKIVTAFTVAHTITLLLASLDIVRVPSRITEAAIAGSIVYVAAENLLRPRAGQGDTRRWPLAFGFGLVHGLGFASALRDRLVVAAGGTPSVGRLVVPVLTFNMGVEFGQLAVLAAVLPLLTLVRARGPRAASGLIAVTSTPIFVLGLYWFLLRITS